jgi:hypothetical protein
MPRTFSTGWAAGSSTADNEVVVAPLPKQPISSLPHSVYRCFPDRLPFGTGIGLAESGCANSAAHRAVSQSQEHIAMAKSSRPIQTPVDRSAKAHVPSPPRRLDLGPAEQPGREEDLGRAADRGRRPPHRK